MKTAIYLFFLMTICIMTLDAQTDDWLIKLPSTQSISNLHDQKSPKITEISMISSELNLYRFRTSQVVSQAKIRSYLDKYSVLSAYPNKQLQQRDRIPDDLEYSKQWNMDIINAPAIWEHTTGGALTTGEEIVVAILDDGFDIEHIDLVDNLWTNKAEISNDGLDNDNNGIIDDYHGYNIDDKSEEHDILTHGTNVYGIIAAKGNNGRGVAGVNWNSKIMPISGVTQVGEIIQAMEYVISMKQRYLDTDGAEGANVMVTNLSSGVDFGFPEGADDWCNLYERAGAVGILSVCAVPNDDYNIDELGDLPSLCPSDYLLSVTNTDDSDNKVQFAAYGPLNVDIGAPGENVLTTDTGNEYSLMIGTSASSPHIAGVIALLYSVDCSRLQKLIVDSPSEAALLMRRCIMASTDRISSLQNTKTGGRINLSKAYDYLIDYCDNESSDELIINYISYKDETVFLNFDSEILGSHLVRIYSADGRLIYQSDIAAASLTSQVVSYEIPLANLTAGTYILNLSSNNSIANHKFVVPL